jgi:hypothetical protein
MIYRVRLSSTNDATGDVQDNNVQQTPFKQQEIVGLDALSGKAARARIMTAVNLTKPFIGISCGRILLVCPIPVYEVAGSAGKPLLLSAGPSDPLILFLQLKQVLLLFRF